MEFHPISHAYIFIRSLYEKLQNNNIDMQYLMPTLAKYIENMEYAISNIGLVVLQPTSGEPFNQYLHVHTRNEFMQDGTPIKFCTSPGIYRLIDANEKSIVLRAEVEV